MMYASPMNGAAKNSATLRATLPGARLPPGRRDPAGVVRPIMWLTSLDDRGRSGF
jgi:hypothetical protein